MDMENRPTNSPKMIFLFKATITRNRSKVLEKPSGVTHDYNPNTHEAEAEGSWIMNQIAWPKSTILPQKEPRGGGCWREGSARRTLVGCSEESSSNSSTHMAAHKHLKL